MFAVVADVERYPEFLPWCARLAVMTREKDGGADIVIAEMTVAYHGLSESYVSRVRADPRERVIEAVHIEGPFKKLDTCWRFVPAGEGCEVQFSIVFAFKSMLLSAMAGLAFGLVASRMAEAFVARAKVLYGSEKTKQQV
jgi:coenzyme Q-binding protein COQ10